MAHSPTPGVAEVETGSSLWLIGQLAWPTRPFSAWAQEKRWITPEDPHARISDLD